MDDEQKLDEAEDIGNSIEYYQHKLNNILDSINKDELEGDDVYRYENLEYLVN